MTGASIETPRHSLRRWLPWLGALIGAAALAWVLRGFDLSRFLTIATGIDGRFVLMVPLTIIVEQIVRGWKWRQLLWPLRAIGSAHLFGAVMAGYLLAIVVPFGFGTVTRSWLVARRENLKFSTVLATVALDRLTDGIVFACLVPAAVLLVAFLIFQRRLKRWYGRAVRNQVELFVLVAILQRHFVGLAAFDDQCGIPE